MKTIDVEYSQFQLDYIDIACKENPLEDHRWNAKVGATRSGKTTLDFMYVIPFRLMVREALDGECAITGVSLGTINRNVLEPMRNYWSKLGYDKVVSETHKDVSGNTFVNIFGSKVYLIGMEKVNAVAKLRGAEFKYCYCDELAECNEEAFGLLKSRLSKPYSCCDFTCNPKDDTHWLYAFINSNIDIYVQNYTIFDNPFLSKKFVESLCDEYSGTVLYDRYILGLWKKAEGIVYRALADNTKEYTKGIIPEGIERFVIGVDFGGNHSAHTFVLTGIGRRFSYAIILESQRVEANGIDPNVLNNKFVEFVRMAMTKYQVNVLDCYCDSAEQTLINGMRNRVLVERLPIIIHNACKRPINDRIRLITRLLGSKKIYWMFNATTSLNAMSTCVYSDKPGHQDERLDNGTTDIDTVDATEYTIEPFMKEWLMTLEMGR